MAQPPCLARGGGEIRVPPRPGPISGPVVLMPRRVPGGVLATLDALAAEALPRLDYGGPAAGLRRAMRAALALRLPRPRWLANWLLDDVLDHAALLAELTGAPSLRVTLDTPPGAAEAALAAGPALCRLITAYRGSGFDWLPPRVASGMAEAEAPAATLLRRLPRGDVAILRGGGHPGGPGVAHRAACGACAALLLTIDAVDVQGRAPAFAGRRDETLQ